MATTTTGHMNILPGFKLCRKGLHKYPADNKRCIECHTLSAKKWRNKHKEKLKKYNQEYYKNNKEKLCKINKEWKNKNNLQHRNACIEWHKKNPGQSRALYAKQRAIKKQAIPPWADINKIKEIYKKAVELTEKTGVIYHVDHIYPLRSKYMCGLHVETNLQVITKKENLAKGNRFWPGQLDCQKN